MMRNDHYATIELHVCSSVPDNDLKYLLQPHLILKMKHKPLLRDPLVE